MRNPETWQGAVVLVDAGGQLLPRPAAFVFDLGGGRLAWVEPSYADPAGGGSPAVHFAENVRPDPSGQGVQCDGGAWTATLLPYDPEDHRDMVGDALEWFGDWLKTERRTWDEERARVRPLIS